MNREDLEKMFEEKVTSTRMYDEYQNDITNEVKQFIFDEIVKEVLESIIDEDDFIMVNEQYFKGYVDKVSDIKQKAKKLYNITL